LARLLDFLGRSGRRIAANDATGKAAERVQVRMDEPLKQICIWAAKFR
jgi:hypothetical protein